MCRTRWLRRGYRIQWQHLPSAVVPPRPSPSLIMPSHTEFCHLPIFPLPPASPPPVGDTYCSRLLLCIHEVQRPSPEWHWPPLLQAQQQRSALWQFHDSCCLSIAGTRGTNPAQDQAAHGGERLLFYHPKVAQYRVCKTLKRGMLL